MCGACVKEAKPKQGPCKVCGKDVGGGLRCSVCAAAFHSQCVSSACRKVRPFVCFRCRPAAAETTETHVAPQGAKPELMAVALVKRVVRGMRTGEQVVVEWSRGDTEGKWLGVLVQKGTAHVKAKIRYIAEWCDKHQGWHEWPDVEDEAAATELPEEDRAYRRLTVLVGTEQLDLDVTPRCAAIDEDEEDEEVAAAKEELEKMQKQAERDDEEKKPLGADLPGNPLWTRAGFLAGLFVYTGKPKHVHPLVWAELTESTRAHHARLLRKLATQLDGDLRGWTVPRAVVEFVLRRATKWSWSYISSTLSSIATALRILPMYTNASKGIDLRRDAYFASALSQAAHRARIASIEPKMSQALSVAHLGELKKRVAGCPGALDLLLCSWEFAMRVADARRIQPQRVQLKREGGRILMQVTIVEGKSVRWTGPYAVVAELPEPVARRLEERVTLAKSRGMTNLWSLEEQQRLSEAVAAMRKEEKGDYSLRSIRKGRLQFLSAVGATKPELVALSRHQNLSTLQIYLGFGTADAEAVELAKKRAERERHVLAAVDEEPVGGGPMKVGTRSGYAGSHGQRVCGEPKMCPLRPPTREELGLPPRRRVGFRKLPLPLHVKPVTPISLERLRQITTGEIGAALDVAMQWMTDPSLLGVTWPPMSKAQVPAMHFTAEQVSVLLEAGKLVRYDGVILAYCKGFGHDEEDKDRTRPVFEACTNASLLRHLLPSMHYPSRVMRRWRVARGRYYIELDMSAWFDQFELPSEMHPYHVVKDAEGNTYALTKLPMGASQAPAIAQTALWAILQPIIEGMPEVDVATCIDNVAISSSNADAFLLALETIQKRCDACGAQLKEPLRGDFSDSRYREELLRAAEEAATAPKTFLGEELWLDGDVPRCRNAPKQVEKLREAFERVQRALEGREQVTKRQLASLVGLINWMALTKSSSFRLAAHHELLKLFCILGKTTHIPWDGCWELTPRQVDALGKAVGPLIRNEWDVVEPIVPPSTDSTEYDATLVCDASGSGFGGFACIHSTGEVYELRSGWKPNADFNRLSARAEPIAVVELVRFLRQSFPECRRWAIATDHQAIVEKQQKWFSRTGGFSAAWHLNEVFRVMDEMKIHATFFFVHGCENPADMPSRCSQVGDPLRMRKNDDVTIPHLSSFYHPHIGGGKERWWQV